MSVGIPLMIFAMVVTGQSESSGDSASTAPRVKLQTSKGDIVIELAAAASPATVASFLGYVEKGFFDGTIFHRVIPGFMIQGGGFTAEMNQKPTDASILNEADNGLSNARGTIAMARTSDPHSATAQFFINLADNTNLDHSGKNPAGWGYCVFGHVVEGMDVVDAIAAVKTGYKSGHQDVPTESVTITKATALN